MKRSTGWGLAALVIVAAGLGGWWKGRGAADGAAADAAAPAPVAQVRSEVPRVQGVAQTLDVVGEVSASQASGLSFARAGQVTQLSVVVGDRVAEGQALATLVPDPAVRQAWQQAVDAVGLAKREWDRQQQLMAAHLATQSQVDAAEKAWRDAQGALKALDEQGGGQGTSVLKAPFDGVVTAVAALQGDRVQAGAAVLQVARADVLRVVLGIEPGDRGRVREGTRVTLRQAVGPSASASAVDLKISAVQAAVDPKTQLLGAIALLPRGLAASWAPGMKVTARLQLGDVQALALPRDAVLTDERGDYVYQVAGGKAHRAAVVRTLDNGTLVAISGLANAALPVVVEGNYELQDGMAVKDAVP